MHQHKKKETKTKSCIPFKKKSDNMHQEQRACQIQDGGLKDGN